MKTSNLLIPETLNRYLTTAEENASPISLYTEEGGKLVTTEAMAFLRKLMIPLCNKIQTVKDSDLFRRRLELFVLYFDEAVDPRNDSDSARREVAFALLYFLKGYDRIVDSISEIGLLDDAMVVDSVLERHKTTIRAFCINSGRDWPDDL